jgi:hypothetical protein
MKLTPQPLNYRPSEPAIGLSFAKCRACSRLYEVPDDRALCEGCLDFFCMYCVDDKTKMCDGCQRWHANQNAKLI